MKKATRIIPALLISSLLLTLPASANSAKKGWNGTDATGTMITDQNCPIVVEGELLTFDISEFPEESYNSEYDFLAYSGSVTAEYTFYNPADYTVTATLAFPFGKLPEYVHFARNDYADRYGVSVNGSPIQATVRHTMTHMYSGFDVEKELPKLADEYIDNYLYKPDTPVYRQTYTVSGIDEQLGWVTAAFVWRGGPKLISHMGGWSLSNGYRQRTYAKNGDEITLWFIGSYPDSIPWRLYEEAACETPAEGAVQLAETEQMTFEQFALQSYDPDSGISQIDWYNSIVTYLTNHQSIYDTIENVDRNLDITHSLLRWYEYEITLQPGERITNTVTAPIYPGINAYYTPSIYDYTYLLSPAKTWSAFGSLDIVVNTPFYITESSIEGFEKTDSGYALSLNGLPDGDLNFTMSESKNPVYAVNPLTIIACVIPLLPFLILLIALVIGIVILVRHKRRQKRNSSNR